MSLLEPDMQSARKLHEGMDAQRLLSCRAMAAADRAAIDTDASAGGTTSVALMETAGRAVGSAALDLVPPGARVVVLCGPGNNGGDGFVAARYLRERGRDAVVALLGEREAIAGDAGVMARRYGGDWIGFHPECVSRAELVIDAVFGAGLNRPIASDGMIARTFAEVERRDLPVLAIDVPSGLNGDTGVAGGVVLAATHTVTFFRRKPGHLLVPGRYLCGRITVADIGIPQSVLQVSNFVSADGAGTWSNAPELWLHHLGGASRDAHKYDRGHTLVVSGPLEMSGAARLSARAALRIGSGLVTVAAPADALAAHASQFNAIMLAKGQGPDALRRHLSDRRKNAVVLGPGLGLEAATSGHIEAVLASGASVVLDADALTLAAMTRDEFVAAIGAHAERPVVLTPHEGEFARLFPQLQGSKLERARAAAKSSGSVVVLKGPDTVIAAPDGRAAINENAPPWLGTAGSGDVLAGMIAGLLAQGVPGFEAACAGVHMHGAAALAFGRGLVAEDIPEQLPLILQELGGAGTCGS